MIHFSDATMYKVPDQLSTRAKNSDLPLAISNDEVIDDDFDFNMEDLDGI